MKAIALGPQLYEYIVRRFAQEERDLLASMLPRAQRAGLPEIQISEEQAKLVRILLRLSGARRALDVGTLFGYSAAIMARAMGPEGQVVSLELEERVAKVARDNLAALGLAKQVEVVTGPALDAMQGLKAASFDVVHIDADKANYLRYLEEGVRLLRDGGLLLADNAFAFGRILESTPDPDVAAMQRFNEAFAKHPALESVLIPVGDGLACARVHRRDQKNG